MSKDLVQNDPTLAALAVTEEETKKQTEALSDRIPSLNLIQGDNPVVRAKKATHGDWYDSLNEQALGETVDVLVVARKYIVRAFEGQNDFKESLFLEAGEDPISSRKRLDFDKSCRDKGYKCKEGHDLLVYLPKYNVYRHIWFKGMMREDGIKVVSAAIFEGQRQILTLTTRFEESDNKKFNWYRVDLTETKKTGVPPEMDKPLKQFSFSKEEEKTEAESPTRVR